MTVSLFGLLDVEDKLPLHDHPFIHGFIKVIYGKFQVFSFSAKSDVAPEIGGEIETFYEGVQVVTPEDDVIYLAPGYGNIHEIRALEPISIFIDILIPGYGSNTAAHYEMPRPLPPPKTKVTLKRKRKHFWTTNIDYPTLSNL
ncbi:unnamed protein product, partial [Mesorhabditis belari]